MSYAQLKAFVESVAAEDTAEDSFSGTDDELSEMLADLSDEDLLEYRHAHRDIVMEARALFKDLTDKGELE